MSSSAVERRPKPAGKFFRFSAPLKRLGSFGRERLAGSHAFAFHHRLDFVAGVGTILILLMLLMSTVLPIEALLQMGDSPFNMRSALSDWNIGSFMLLFFLTLLLSSYWLVQAFQNRELTGSRLGRNWPNIIVLWLSLLFLNSGPFFLANIVQFRIDGRVRTTLMNFRGSDFPWDGWPLLLYVLMLGFVAYAFKIIKTRGFGEPILGIVTVFVIAVAYIITTVNYGPSISLYLRNDLGWGRTFNSQDTADFTFILVSIVVMWVFCLVYPLALAVRRAPTSRTSRIAFLSAAWSMPAVVAWGVFWGYSVLKESGSGTVQGENFTVAAGIILVLLIEPLLHARGNAIWAMPRR
jgi:hypothetical protein